jgi:hypothetical protein
MNLVGVRDRPAVSILMWADSQREQISHTRNGRKEKPADALWGDGTGGRLKWSRASRVAEGKTGDATARRGVSYTAVAIDARTMHNFPRAHKKATGPEDEACRFRPRRLSLHELVSASSCSGLEGFADYALATKKPHQTVDGPRAAQSRHQS